MIQREQWHLTEGLIFAHFAVFILSTTMKESQQALALIPGLVGSRPWTLVTYQFIHGSSMFWFFISMLVLWIMAKPLEENWGSPRFLIFWMVATFGASVTAALIGRPLFGDLGFSSCLLFTFATLFPEVEFRLFFIIPVKVKYLAIVAAAILVYSSLSLGLVAGLANIAEPPPATSSFSPRAGCPPAARSRSSSPNARRRSRSGPRAPRLKTGIVGGTHW